MLPVAVSLFLGACVSVLCPEYALYDTRVRWPEDPRTRYGLSAAAIAAGLVCTFALLTYRSRVSERCVRLCFLGYAASRILILLLPTLFFTVQLTLTVVLESTLWLSVSQTVCVIRVDEAAYNLGVALGTGLRLYGANVTWHGTTATLIFYTCYVALYNKIYDLPFVREDLSFFEAKGRRYANRYEYVDSKTVVKVCYDTLTVATLLSLVCFVLRGVSPAGFAMYVLVSHLRVPGVAYRCVTHGACALAGIAAVIDSIVGGVFLPAVADFTAGLAGLMLRNHVLERFGDQDRFLGNTACAVTALLALPHLKPGQNLRN
uniref:GP43 protein n=1 Tax=Cardioderma bat herpesvirus TaxID=3141914 RepID=A0AAU7DZX3_9VIRU